MWFYAALLMASITGVFVVVSKYTLKNMDPVIFYWAAIVASTPLIFVSVLVNGVPALDQTFFLCVLGSVIFYSVSKIIFWHTIKNSPLSELYPLVSIGPVFTLAWSVILLSEKLSFLAFIGSGITLLGTYILNISSAREGLLKPFKIIFRDKFSLLMVISILIGSIVTIFDKTAIYHTFPQDAYFVAFFENLLIIAVLSPWILKKRKVALKEILENKKLLMILGIIFSLSTFAGFFALANGNPGLVSSVFRTQVFFVFLFSFLWFKDKPKIETIVGSIIMILGLVITKLFS